MTSQGDDNNELLEQVTRIVQSSAFHGSETLRHLLQFLARQSIDHPGHPIKERDIAHAVFRRAEDFDPQNESVVRVQTGRLRSKLAEYYVGEGAADPLIVELPRGAYQLTSHRRASAPGPAQTGAASTGSMSRWRRRAVPLLIAGAVAAAAGAAGYLVGTAADPEPKQSPGLITFWRAFTEAKDPPLLIFGNPRFVGSDFNGMRYWRDSDDPREAVVDTYTTVGDLAGVFEITRQLGAFRKPPNLKRAQLLTWDDTVDRNLLVVGSPISIRALREHPFLEKFVFKDRTEEPRVGVGAIRSLAPGTGEEQIYYGPEARPYQFDYAVIAYVPGVTPQRRTLVLAGITSHGTQAAAEFVCREELVQQLLQRLRAAGGSFPVNFECLLRVRVSGGVPVHPEILAVKIRQP